MYKFTGAFVLKGGKKDSLCIYLISRFNCSSERAEIRRIRWEGGKERNLNNRDLSEICP